MHTPMKECIRRGSAKGNMGSEGFLQKWGEKRKWGMRVWERDRQKEEGTKGMGKKIKLRIKLRYQEGNRMLWWYMRTLGKKKELQT